MELADLLAEGRKKYPSDEQYGQWIERTGLGEGTSSDERSRATWLKENWDKVLGVWENPKDELLDKKVKPEAIYRKYLKAQKSLTSTTQPLRKYKNHLEAKSGSVSPSTKMRDELKKYQRAVKLLNHKKNGG